MHPNHWRTLTALGSLPLAILLTVTGGALLLSNVGSEYTALMLASGIGLVGAGGAATLAGATVLAAQAMAAAPGGVPRFGAVTWWLLALMGLFTSAGTTLVFAVTVLGQGAP